MNARATETLWHVTVLSNFAREAGKLGDRGTIPAVQAGALAASANRIRAVEGCVK